MQRLRIVGAALAAITLLGGVTACGDDTTTDPSQTVVIDVTLKDGKVDPSGDRVEVSAGQPIDIVVTADVPGSLHVHSDPEQEFAYEAGTETFKFEIDRPGVVAVESHELEQIIVQLEVR